MSKFFETDIIFQANRYYLELRDWLLPMLMNGQVEVKSVSTALDLTMDNVSSSAVENGYLQENGDLGNVGVSGFKNGKG